MGKKIRHKDIAARLSLSGTLVSLVLNNKADQQGIRKETQEKVLTMARHLGYFDNPGENIAASPVEEKPGVIGFFVPSVNDPFVNQIAPNLHKAFSTIGLGFTIISLHAEDQSYNRMINSFKKFLSGMIIFGDAVDNSTIRTLKSSNYPLIIIEGQGRDVKLNSVSTDNSVGADLVISHIEKLGYKNILIIAEKKSLTSYSDELKIITDTISKKSGINAPVIAEVDNLLSGAEFNLGQIGMYLSPPSRKDVIIIMTAGLVYPVISALSQKKIRVPQDIAVISMEDNIGFDMIHSPVTSLRKPISEMAGKLANILWSEIRNSGKGKFIRQVKIAPVLIIRKSCGSI